MNNHRNNQRRGHGGGNKGKSTRRKHQQAWAPYNFVPMPDKPLYADVDDRGIPALHNLYIANRHTGYFNVKLRTVTPLFIRGMLTVDNYENKPGEAPVTDKEIGDKIRKNPDFFGIGNNKPIIPGSSLRGMLRTLVEIVTNSKMHFVSDANPMFFRAVAADRSDPLKAPYAQVIGSFGKNVRAGYLVKDKGRWYIRPARKIGRAHYGKVKDWNKKQNYSPVDGVKDLIRLSDPKYKVQYHTVCYDANGDFVSRVYSPEHEQEHEGVLVCTGNMAETQGKNNPGKRVNTPRKNYALVANPNPNAPKIAISTQTIKDYLEGMSPFQQDDPFDKANGILEHGRPVFYISDGEQVIHFGHTPNFRIAPLTIENNVVRAKNPLDLVPPTMRKTNPKLDYAEAMFGYVSEQDETRQQSAYASRISVTGATVTEQLDSYTYDPIVPKILASPKPTTFQHYLMQANGVNTPTDQLRHYGDDAKIRGHKLYWRQKIASLAQIETQGSETPENSTQHTRISPVREDISFQFKVHFDNLTDAELGALIWVLSPGDDENAHHQMGMAKPLGLGVVKLTPELILTNRTDQKEGRYGSLFTDNGHWETGEKNVSEDEWNGYINKFKGKVNFDQNRFKELITMLQLIDSQTMKQLQPDKSRDFDYMKIESDSGNDYQGRPVLPAPTQIERGIYDD